MKRHNRIVCLFFCVSFLFLFSFYFIVYQRPDRGSVFFFSCLLRRRWRLRGERDVGWVGGWGGGIWKPDDLVCFAGD